MILSCAGALQEHLGAHLRVFFFGKYAIHYLPLANQVIIVRVLDGSHDVASISDEGGFLA